jgi:predicted ATPase/DNA-binding SARP family transcriptional activator
MVGVAGQALRITLAGGCRLATHTGAWEVEVPTRQGRLVLARLVLEAGPVTRDDLADLLWSDVLPRAWERDLSVVVSKLRRLLGAAPPPARATIRRGPGVYELVLPGGSVVDVTEATAAAERAQVCLRQGRLDEAVSAARQAVEVARRPLVPGAEAVWVDGRREWLRSVPVRALTIEVDVAIRNHDPGGLGAAAEAVAADPTSERAYANQMRLHLALGETAAALKSYGRYRAVVVDELGLPPAPELERLCEAAGNRSEIRVARGPSRPAQPSTMRSGALPIATTTFVGRAQALSDVAVAFEMARLVTITGPAGVGKSRLALEAAHRLAPRHRDGVHGCELAHVSHPDGVVPALAASLGVTPDPGMALDQSVVDALVSRRLLLVVDNCEHVLPVVVPLLEGIVGRCPAVHVLATSRERLAADGEAVVPLEPLELPDAGADPPEAWTRPAPALELLRDRIEAVRPGFAPRPEEQAALVEVCRRLDGLPLAIELAAARTAAMAPLDVARRLDRRLAVLTQGRRTAPARHRTLRAAIEWSYDLLDEPQRHAFERASVFSGGLTLPAAERVCAGELLAPDDVADVLGTLVDKSLLVLDQRRFTTRYTMLETLREFAREQLAAREDAAGAALAHAEYFAALARDAEPGIRGPAEAEWASLLDAEVANLRVAHEWARRAGRDDLAAGLSADLAWFAFWRMRTEAFSWAERLADALAAESRTGQAEALAAAGRGAWMRGDLARSETLARRAVDNAKDDVAARYGWHVLGDVGLFSGRLDQVYSAYERADDLGEIAGDGYHCTLLRGCRALVRAYAGDAAAAFELATQSRALGRASGNPTAAAWSDYVTGEVLMTTDPDRALVHLERAAATAEAVANEFVRGVAGLSAISLRARHGDPADAARAFVEIIDRWERGGNWRQQWTTMRQAVELLVRLERPRAAALVLGAIERVDAENIYGPDAERLERLRRELHTYLGPDLDLSFGDAEALDRADVVAFVRGEFLAAGHPGDAPQDASH